MATITQYRAVINTLLAAIIGLVLINIDLTLQTCKLSVLKQFTTSSDTMGVYTRSELLQFQNNNSCNARLPQAVWRTILSLGIVKDDFQPTRVV
jgi:hypothetical protein